MVVRVTERERIGQMTENMEMMGEFLSELIYLAHKGDTKDTAADWAGMGAIWRDRTQWKSLETCRMHLGRCNSCWERLRAIIGQYKKRPSRN